MTTALANRISDIRDRFAHVDSDPFTGPRVFFENAGGALTLKSVVDTTTRFAAIPDNQGRDNAAAHALGEIIAKAKSDMMTFFGARLGQVFVGESGTELLFRLIRTAAMQTGPGAIIGSTVEHPASRSAAQHWAEAAGKRYVSVLHDDATGTVDAAAYAAQMTEDVRVATVLHTSPVTGMTNDVAAIIKAIRAVAPDAFVIVDGIQHACHGLIDLAEIDADGYVISPYKVFSRHGYGVAWASDRLSALQLETLKGGPHANWELGTRDTGAYATMSDVVSYFEWLGTGEGQREKILSAGAAIKTYERSLTDAMLFGTNDVPGLCASDDIQIVGGKDNPAREGLVTFASKSVNAGDIVAQLNAKGIRTHIRKADHYSGNILGPLGLESAVRVSVCHYNTLDEVAAFLSAMHDILNPS